MLQSPSRRSPPAGATDEPPPAFVQCKKVDCVLFECRYLTRQILQTAIWPGVTDDADRSRSPAANINSGNGCHDRAQSLAFVACVASRRQRTPARGSGSLDRR